MNMKNPLAKDATYRVRFDTAIHPYTVDVVVMAKNEERAKTIARRVCKFGILKSTTKLDPNKGYTDGCLEYPRIATEENTTHLAWI